MLYDGLLKINTYLALACGLLLATAALATDCDDACTAMRKILAARSTDFVELKGVQSFHPQANTPRDFQLSQWNGVLAPAGMNCSVVKSPQGSLRYFCSTLPQLLAQQQAVQIYLNVAMGARAAAPDWKYNRIRLETEGVPTGEKIIGAAPGEAQPALQIILAKKNGSRASKSWYVDMDVYAAAPKK